MRRFCRASGERYTTRPPEAAIDPSFERREKYSKMKDASATGKRQEPDQHRLPYAKRARASHPTLVHA